MLGKKVIQFNQFRRFPSVTITKVSDVCEKTNKGKQTSEMIFTLIGWSAGEGYGGSNK